MLERLRGWLRKAIQAERAQPSTAQRKFVEALGSPGAYGWTADRHEQHRHYVGWAYIAVRAISNAIASKPPLCGRTSGGPQQPRRTKALEPTSSTAEGFEPFDAAHPLARLLNDPNEPDVGYDLWFETVLNLMLSGSAYWWTPPNGFGLPAEAWVIPAPWVHAVYKGTGKWVDSYRIRTYGGGSTIDLPAEEVIHFKQSHPWDKRDGYSPLSACSLWLDTQYSIDRARLAAFKNGSEVDLHIALGERYGDPDDEVLKRAYAKWDARFAGESNRRKPLLTGFDTKVTTISNTPVEMAFIESADQIRDYVLSVFGVPYPVAMMVGGATFENADQATQNYHRYTLNPLRTKLGQVLTEKLGKRFDPSTLIYWPDDTPKTHEQQIAEDQLLFNCGALQVNELRQKYGYEALPDGDRSFLPAGLLSLDEAGLPPPAPSTDDAPSSTKSVLRHFGIPTDDASCLTPPVSRYQSNGHG